MRKLASRCPVRMQAAQQRWLVRATEASTPHAFSVRCAIATKSLTIIIPTFNSARRITKCLEALGKQALAREAEVLVINDGSTDETARVVGGYSCVRLINQANTGPAAARNRGALEAQGAIILFTDDDCVPEPDWIEAMLSAFNDPEVVGAKGVYRTHQTSLIARFVQIEYEDRYRLMAGLASIDFVDTYSAGFRRDRFMEMDGYDTSFPVACAEDIELSYRMSARGWKMKFVPEAVVYHTHPDTLWKYLRKKYKFAFWRVLAVRKNPSKVVKDSHTPQLMKLQLLFAPALALAVVSDMILRPATPASGLVLATFFASAIPFAIRALRKDLTVGIFSPLLLAARTCAQAAGVAVGMIYARRKAVPLATNSAA